MESDTEVGRPRGVLLGVRWCQAQRATGDARQNAASSPGDCPRAACQLGPEEFCEKLARSLGVLHVRRMAAPRPDLEPHGTRPRHLRPTSSSS